MPKLKVVLVGGDALKEKLKALGRAAASINQSAAMAGAEIIEAEAEMNAPGPHIYSEVVKANEKQAEVAIGPDKEHWYYQFSETGATAHEIKAAKGEWLAFEGDNGLVITKKVKHPGMAARPFLRRAMNMKKDAAKERAGEVFRAAIERAGNGS